MASKFNFSIVYGGAFFGNSRENTGKSGVEKNYDRDLIAYFDLKEVMKKYGYKEGDKFYYCRLGSNPPKGLVEIVSDKECMEMMQERDESKLNWCSLYIKPGVEEDGMNEVIDDGNAEGEEDEEDEEPDEAEETSDGNDTSSSNDSVEDPRYIYNGPTTVSTSDSDGGEYMRRWRLKHRNGKDVEEMEGNDIQMDMRQDDAIHHTFEGDDNVEELYAPSLQPPHVEEDDIRQSSGDGRPASPSPHDLSAHPNEGTSGLTPRAARAARRNNQREADCIKNTEHCRSIKKINSIHHFSSPDCTYA